MKTSPKLTNIILESQSLFAAPVFLSILLKAPPLWLSWIIALIPWGLRWWHTGQPIKRTPFDIPILIFTAGVVIGFFVSPDKTISLEGLNTYLACVLIYYGITNNSEAKNSYWLTFGSVICLLIFGIVAYTFSQGINRHYFFNEWVYGLTSLIPKIQAPQTTYNTAGAALAPLLPLLLALFVFKQRLWLRLVAAMLSIIFSALLFLSGSATGWLSAVFGLVFVLLCWRLWALALVLPSALLGVWAIVSSWNTSSWLRNIFLYSSVVGRITLWQNTLTLLKEHLLTGVGLGNLYESYSTFYGVTPPINPHNSYLQLYADTGIFGGVAIVYATTICIIICYRILHLHSESSWYAVAIGVFGSLIALAINGIIEVNTSAYLPRDGTIIHYIAIPYIWLLVAFLVVAHKRLQHQ